MKKKLSLAVDFSEDYKIIGISSNLKIFKLAWSINKALKIRFIKVNNLVFEHIKDDEAAFENSFSLLTQGGKLLLFVPAGPKIYGGLDVDMGHYRRYTKEGLVSKAERAGFKIIDCYYTNFIGYFLWWGRGKFLSQLLDKSHSRPDRESIQMNQGPRIDKIFAQFVNLIIAPLLYLEKIIHPPIGQSLVLIAQKTSI